MSGTRGSSVEMPFLDHLEELRWRLLWSLLAYAIALVIAFVLVTKGNVIGILQKPILPYLNGHRLVYTHPGDPFSIVMSASFAVAAVLAAPVILYQLWAFVSPALYRHEKKLVIPVLIGATLLFMAGLALAYFIVLPFSLDFLLGFQAGALEPMITASEYFDFAVSLSLAFGAVFELPILILALTALNIVTPSFLRRFRRHAAALSLAAASIITPGDLVTSTLALWLPLYGLYEVSILLSEVVFRRRARARDEAAAEAAEGVPA